MFYIQFALCSNKLSCSLNQIYRFPDIKVQLWGYWSDYKGSPSWNGYTSVGSWFFRVYKPSNSRVRWRIDRLCLILIIAKKRKYLNSIFQRNIQTRSSLAIQLRNVNALLYDLEYSRNMGMRLLLIVLLLLPVSRTSLPQYCLPRPTPRGVYSTVQLLASRWVRCSVFTRQVLSSTRVLNRGKYGRNVRYGLLLMKYPLRLQIGRTSCNRYSRRTVICLTKKHWKWSGGCQLRYSADSSLVQHDTRCTLVNRVKDERSALGKVETAVFCLHLRKTHDF